MNDVAIRAASEHDAAAVYRMICVLEETKFDKGQFEKVYTLNLGDKNISYLIAEIHHTPVGFLSLYIQSLLHHAGPVAEIQELFVDEKYRGKGVGKLLVARAEEIAKEKRATSFEVTTNCKRTQTHLFYEKVGFHRSHYKFTHNI